MDLDASQLPVWFSVLSWGGATFGLLLGIAWAPWRYLSESRLQHLFLGAVVALLLLWSMRAGINPGLSMHFLGVTTLTLMFAWPLALVAVALVCFGLALAGVESWANLQLVFLFHGVLPVALSWAVLRWVERRLPSHLFIYLFIVVFASAALTAVIMSLALAVLLISLDAYSFSQVYYEYLSFLPLIALPEAMLNGFVMTGMIILRPHWVYTFDDRRYLS